MAVQIKDNDMYAVMIRKEDGAALALGNEGPCFLTRNYGIARQFCDQLKAHLPASRMRVVKVRVSVTVLTKGVRV